MFRKIRGLVGEKKPKRKNRAWVVVVDQHGPKLLNPSYFKQYHPEEDQYKVSVTATLRRLQEKVFGENSKQPLTYLGKFKLKGGSRHKDLYVYYAVILAQEKAKLHMLRDHLQMLQEDNPQHKEVLDALALELQGDQRHTFLQLEKAGAD